jgi:flavin reductase (DIM6/NTAB) family NADH-FMN oxidoreductase RutF
VAESPLAIECRLYQVVPHGNGPLAANYIIGEVVYFHVAERSLRGTSTVDAPCVDYIARMGGEWYARAEPENMFEMPRPPRIEKRQSS